MRVTNGMMQNSSMNSLYTNMGRLDKLFYQMNTLKKIQRPSDDPIIAGRSMKLRLNVMESEQHVKNVDEANAWMNVTEAALKNTTEIIKNIRTKCNYAANGTHTPEDRMKIVDEIEQLYEQLKQESNVTYAGRYVFSGYKVDQPVFATKDYELKEDITLNEGVTFPVGDNITLKGEMTLPKGTVLENDILDADGNILVVDGVELKAGETLMVDVKIPDGTVIGKGSIIPSGATIPAGTTIPKDSLNLEVLNSVGEQNISYEIGVGNTIEVNTTGMASMMSGLMGNIEKMLSALKNPDNTDEDLNTIFTDMIGEMDERLKETSRMESTLGSKQNRLEFTQERLNEDKINFTELLSNTENVDIEEIYVEFNTQYMVYQSALQATSKIVMNTLADFLR
ncbi:MAG: flagellar hook-associated protein FlgL [Cellulosilyticaceae bacterium]